jgi:prefoldin subunit 5
MKSGHNDREISDKLHELHDTIQLIQSQLEAITGTMSSCENIVKANYTECIPAVSIADVEAIRLMELNVGLVKIIHDIKDLVYSKHL